MNPPHFKGRNIRIPIRILSQGSGVQGSTTLWIRPRSLQKSRLRFFPSALWCLGFRVRKLVVTYSDPESWNMALGGLVLESLILYLKGMRILMFQLSGFYYMY